MISNILSLLWIVPLIGLVLVLIGPNNAKTVRWGSVAFSLIPLALAIIALLSYNMTAGAPQFQMVEHYVWFPQINATYKVGVDGISLPLVALTTLLAPLAMLMSFNLQKNVKAFFALFFLLETAVIGAFVSLDLILFFVFYELSLVPMYFMISQWGGDNRRYASLKFILYTMFASLGMLLAIQVIGVASHSYDYEYLISAAGRPFTGANVVTLIPAGVDWRIISFAAFSIAFALKIPIWPLHTWLPDAHTEAPTGGSMMLAGILLKLGGYGFLRFVIPLFPEAASQFAPLLALFAMISIVLGAFAAWGQNDFKKLVAYSSVNHMGFVAMGIAAAAYLGGSAAGHAGEAAPAIFANAEPVITDITRVTGASGALLQMITHGLSSAAMFAVVGIIYDRAHTRDLQRFGGLWDIMPKYGAILVFCAMGSLGLPGLAGFVSEFLVTRSGWSAFTLLTILSMAGLLVTGIYVLKSIQKVLHGPLAAEWAHHPLADISKPELLAVAPLMVLMLVLGLQPSVILNLINWGSQQLVMLAK